MRTVVAHCYECLALYVARQERGIGSEPGAVVPDLLLRAKSVNPAPIQRDRATKVRVEAVLVFSSDPLSGALLGAAIELGGHLPHFAAADESARSALLRVRPRVVLIDCDHEESCSEEFVGPALMTGARVLLIRSARTVRDMSDFATRLRVRIVDMATEHGLLPEILREVIGQVRQ